MGFFGLNEIFSSKGHETKESNEPSRIKKKLPPTTGITCQMCRGLRFIWRRLHALFVCVYWKRGKGIKAVCLPSKDLSNPGWIWILWVASSWIIRNCGGIFLFRWILLQKRSLGHWLRAMYHAPLPSVRLPLNRGNGRGLRINTWTALLSFCNYYPRNSSVVVLTRIKWVWGGP